MKNYNVLIGGYDFEQKIHRGITFYGKALIKALKENNYQISLLTSANKEKEKVLYLLSILRQLDEPRGLDHKNKVKEYIKYKLKSRSIILKNKIEELSNKLNYLKYVDYFYNIPYIYDITTVQNRFFIKKPLNINIKNRDVFITTSPTNIKSNIPLIQTLHDVIPLISIHHPPEDNSKIFYYRLLNMLKYSDKIFSVSNYSKESLLKIFPNYESKIEVTYQPIPVYEEEEEFVKDEIIQKAVLKRFKLTSDNYLFYVGMLEKRKNIKGMIEAYLAIYDKIKIPLVLAGAIGYGNEEFIRYLHDKKLKKKIKYIGYINNIEKLVLLKNARAFLFPSFNEGFGLPSLEAIKMGTYVLTSNITAIPEVGGDACLYVDPYNIKEIADGIVDITINEELRAKLKLNFDVQIEKFNFNNFRSRVDSIIKTIL